MFFRLERICRATALGASLATLTALLAPVSVEAAALRPVHPAAAAARTYHSARTLPNGRVGSSNVTVADMPVIPPD
ncbi:MAG: hypothetical protein IAI50_07440, partial [Candidatus Eremiobacteraeota bacterium]|nr:hypothetical protein [Candidatus Eremiobacteraeota bacterium]